MKEIKLKILKYCTDFTRWFNSIEFVKHIFNLVKLETTIHVIIIQHNKHTDVKATKGMNLLSMLTILATP